ncbi:MAG: hypothetical protein PUG48_05855 [Clostridia bacterium]|nr:hypothetical protein [Clostridia bacterium]
MQSVMTSIFKGILVGFVFITIMEIGATLMLIPNIPDILCELMFYGIPVILNVLCGFILASDTAKNLIISTLTAVVCGFAFFRLYTETGFVRFLEKIFCINSDISASNSFGFGITVIMTLGLVVLQLIIAITLTVSNKHRLTKTNENLVEN